MNSTYDAKSGLLYLDTSVAVPKVSLSKWLKHANGTEKRLKERTTCSIGARSLFEVAKRVVISNREALNKENLSGVPWLVALPVWRSMVKDQLVSISTWFVFASAYSQEIDKCEDEWLPSRHDMFIPQDLGFQAVEYLMKKDFDMITVLEVRTTNTTRAQWYGLCQMRSLRVLAVQNVPAQTSQLDLRVIRAWRNSTEHAGFPNLRALVFGHSYQIDAEWLKELTLIPSLRLCSMAHGLGLQIPNSHMWEFSATGPRTVRELATLPVVQLDDPGYEESLSRRPHKTKHTLDKDSKSKPAVNKVDKPYAERILKPTLQLRLGSESGGIIHHWLRRFAPNATHNKRKDLGSFEEAPGQVHQGKKARFRADKKQSLENSLSDFGFDCG